jgi:hypothetical protein
MALVRSFERKDMERNSIHEEIDATYSVFHNDDKVLIQIDSYGRRSREIPGKKSQSIQLDRVGAEALYRILKTEFNLK